MYGEKEPPTIEKFTMKFTYGLSLDYDNILWWDNKILKYN